MKAILHFFLLPVVLLVLNGEAAAQTPPRRDTSYRHHASDSVIREYPPRQRDTIRHRSRPIQPGDTFYRRTKRVSDTAGKKIPPRDEKP